MRSSAARLSPERGGRLAAAALLLASAAASADELSGADKLRTLYSTQFSFTREGLPVVNVGIVEGLTEVRVRGALRVLPDGEQGAELYAGQDFTVRLSAPASRAERRYHVVVGRASGPQGERLQEEARLWRKRGFTPHTFELGAVFGLRGEVLDARQLQLTVAPHDDEAAARGEQKAIGEKYGLETGLYTELLARPRGTVEARDERGVIVRNDGVLWFAPLRAGDTLRVEPPGRSYAGMIYVTPDKNGALAVGNAVAEDRLLSGLIPAEMNPSAPLEALKAQAVAARNQLLAKLGTRHLLDPYRLCAQTHCQVYAGAGQEVARASQAALQTRGEMLVTGAAGAEQLVDTVYSSSCGGHSEDNDQAWQTRADPILRGHLDLPRDQQQKGRFGGRIGEDLVSDFLLLRGFGQRPFCGRLREAQGAFRWTARVSADALRERLGALGAIKEVKVLQRGASGRAVLLRVVGAAATREIRGELEIRRALAPGGLLKSSLFQLRPVRQGEEIIALEMDGAGHGHGVGLCQYGAMAMGHEGLSYKQILEHYYPGARLRRLY